MEFIPSDRQSFAGEIRGSFAPPFVNIAFALLTPLLHAQRQGFAEFWNIDADDILYYCAPDYLSLCLEHIAEYALSQDIDLCSQDMHASLNRTGSCPWSSGVTFTHSHGSLCSLRQLISHIHDEQLRTYTTTPQPQRRAPGEY